ncbi:MAG: sigma-70 family RNA polymerase sigma factor [Thermoanaerobaculia bacterium]|nr:sigma-70 family RNA polymerase sigma factor [Thermoanaerobaculia bacterium]
MKSKWDDLDYLRQHLERALEDIYRSYQPEFMRVLKREWPSLDQNTCLDIFQDAVILVWTNVKNGNLTHLSSTLSTYLCGIGKNLASGYMRKQGRVSYFDEMLDFLRSGESSAELDFLQREEMELIWKFIDQMDEPYHSVLTLTFKYELSSAEIAEIMNAASDVVVRVQRNRGVKQLKALLKTHLI